VTIQSSRLANACDSGVCYTTDIGQHLSISHCMAGNS